MDDGSAHLDRFVPMQDGIRLHVRDHHAGADGGVPVLCLPGLTRNVKDFDAMVAALGPDRRIVCVSLRGRGQSDRDPDMAHYVAPTYVRDVIDVLGALGIARAVFVGTSLGGIVTMLSAATKPDMVAGAVLNDIGPVVDEAGLQRIRSYAGLQGPEPDWDHAAATVQRINAGQFPGFGAADWQAMARRTYVPAHAGDGVVPDYDPLIGEAMRAAPAAADLWPFFNALGPIPALVIRGALSDILSAETVAAMQAAKPDLKVATVPGRGHAPLLDEPEAVRAIKDLLAGI